MIYDHYPSPIGALPDIVGLTSRNNIARSYRRNRVPNPQSIQADPVPTFAPVG